MTLFKEDTVVPMSLIDDLLEDGMNFIVMNAVDRGDRFIVLKKYDEVDQVWKFRAMIILSDGFVFMDKIHHLGVEAVMKVTFQLIIDNCTDFDGKNEALALKHEAQLQELSTFMSESSYRQ